MFHHKRALDCGFRTLPTCNAMMDALKIWWCACWSQRPRWRVAGWISPKAQKRLDWTSHLHPFPIGSMYAIYGNIYHQYTPNVSNIPYMDPMGFAPNFVPTWAGCRFGMVWTHPISPLYGGHRRISGQAPHQRRRSWPWSFDTAAPVIHILFANTPWREIGAPSA